MAIAPAIVIEKSWSAKIQAWLSDAKRLEELPRAG
jgi:hypothetical protein